MSSRREKIAIVTGAGSGIGKAVSIGLASSGFRVVLVGRRAKPINKLMQQISDNGGTALAIATDISDPEAVTSLFQKIATIFGRLDLLFNNAGTNAPALPMEDIELSDWRTVLEVNVTGAFLCTQQALQLMKHQSPQGGRIINNGSISAHTPRPNSAPYTISKHAITGLTKSTALDGRPFNIACGQIDIGNVATEIGSHVMRGALQANGETKIEPMIDIQNVVDAVCYMAGLPLSANVLSLTVMASGMPHVGRG